MEWHCYTATLAVMTNVRGTGSDWPRNKFSLPSGARGRRKHTRLPKIKDRDHFREESTSANRRAKNTRRELRGVAASSSRTPTIENQAQPRKIKRPSRRSNMEIGRARTPRRISSNASQITSPANKSTKQSGIENKLCPSGAHPAFSLAVRYQCITSTFAMRCRQITGIE